MTTDTPPTKGFRPPRFLSTPLWAQVLIAMALGAAAGLAAGPAAEAWFGWLGDLYVNAIKMLVLPLVFVTVTTSLPRLAGATNAARLGARTFGWFVATSAAAVAIGLTVGTLWDPGAQVAPLTPAETTPKEIPTFTQVLVSLVPANVFAAFAEGKVLQVLVISALVGAALLALGDKVAGLRAGLEQAADVVFKVTRWVLRLTPIGVFGLIAEVVGLYGLEKLLPLAGFIGAVFLACAIHIGVVYAGLIKLHGLSVRQFFRGAFAAQQTAFATASSMATLPVSLKTVTDRFGVPAAYAGFALPMGANMKMDACGAIYPAISAIFIASYFGLELSAAQYGIIAFTAILGTLATAGVPGTATVMLTLTLGAAGLPLEGIGLLVTVDRVVDMVRTMTNVTGQMLVPVLVAKEEGVLDQAIYDGRPEPEATRLAAQ